MEFVYNKLLEQKKQGMATLLISRPGRTMLLCNRIAVMYRESYGYFRATPIRQVPVGPLIAESKAMSELQWQRVSAAKNVTAGFCRRAGRHRLLIAAGIFIGLMGFNVLTPTKRSSSLRSASANGFIQTLLKFVR